MISGTEPPPFAEMPVIAWGRDRAVHPVNKGKVPPRTDPEPVSLVILWAFQLSKGHWTPLLDPLSAFYLGFSSKRREGAKTSYKLFLKKEEKLTSQVLRNEKDNDSEILPCCCILLTRLLHQFGLHFPNIKMEKNPTIYFSHLMLWGFNEVIIFVTI